MDIIQHSFIWNRCVNRLLLGKEQKMTREEAIAIIRKEYACVDADCDIERNCGRCELHMPSKEPILKAYEMAIQALSQEPISLDDINNALGASFRNGVRSAKVEQEPCEDVVSREAVKDILNNSYSLTDAEHRVEQLPSVTQKPIECDDAISREYLKKIAQSEGAYGYVSAHDIATAPSVTQKSGHWIHFAQSDDCSECGWSTGKYISPSKFCPNCGARMFEPQESEE